jgi:hypothetical protein
MADDSKNTFMNKAIAEKELNDAFAACFSTPAGKTVLEHLAQAGHLFTGVYDENPYAMCHNEGWRSAVLYILQRIDANDRDPLTRFQRMLAQQNDRKESRQ